MYTTYLAMANKLPEDMKRIYICRYLPPSLKLRNGDMHLKGLSPSPQILQMYKKGRITFEKLVDLFLQDVYSRENVFLRAELRRLDINNACLICYEKDVEKCHRKHAADFVSGVTGVEYKGEYNYED